MMRALRRRSGAKKAAAAAAAPRVVTYEGVSMEFLIDFARRVAAGSEAPDVRLFVLLVDAPEGVAAGTTLRLEDGGSDSGDLSLSSAHTPAVRCPSGAAREKPRSEWSTEDVCQYVVLPACVDSRCFYLELLPEGQVGRTFEGTFVSQARKCSFGALVQALAAHFAARGDAPASAFVWLDLFSGNQPLLTQALTATAGGAKERRRREEVFTRGLHQALDRFEARVIFFDSWSDPAPLQRSWCVWEVYGCIRTGKSLPAIFAPGQDEAFLAELRRDADAVTQSIADIDTRRAQCFKAEDKAMIDGAIKRQLKHGFSTLNKDILASLRGWLTDIAHRAVAVAERDYSASTSSAAVGAVGASGEGPSNEAPSDDNEEAEGAEEAEDVDEAEDVKDTKDAKDAKDAKALDYASVLNSAGLFLYAQGDVAGAERHYASSLAIRLAVLGVDSHEVATTLNNVAGVQLVQGRLDDALEAYERVLGMNLLNHGEDHTYVASALNNVGTVYKEQGKLDDALAAYERALRINRARLGGDDPLVAVVLGNIAAVQVAKGDLDAALEAHREVLRLRLASMGPRHPSVAETTHNVAHVLFLQGRLDEAAALFEEALDIYEERLGEDHVRVASTLNALAHAREGQGSEAEALELFERALAIRKQALGAQHVLSLDAQASVDFLRKRALGD